MKEGTRISQWGKWPFCLSEKGKVRLEEGATAKNLLPGRHGTGVIWPDTGGAAGGDVNAK